MSASVIKVQNLSKKYTLGQTHTNLLSERMGNGLRSAFRRILRNGSSNLKPDTSNLTPNKDFWALKDVSFEVGQGEVLGIIGRNGAGKSTLLKILSRITAPTSGTVELYGRVASLLEVGTGFHPELTGRENIFLNGAILGMNRAEIKRKFDEIVAFAEVEKFIDTPVKRYSSGMYVRLAFAVAAHLEPEILIIDEVLAVGDAQFQKKCLGKMGDVAKEGRTVLFVSHNMDSIQKLCSSAIHLSSGEIKEYGNIPDVIAKYLGQYHRNESNYIIPFGNKLKSSHYIEKIEILNLNGSPKDYLRSWDSVRFRIFFYLPTEIKNVAIVLQIATLSGVNISVCSTHANPTVKIKFMQGVNVIDCVFPKLMLSAGHYLIGAGLAMPNAEWLYKAFDNSIFDILHYDVYKSGVSPDASRYLIPQEYSWEIAQ